MAVSTRGILTGNNNPGKSVAGLCVMYFSVEQQISLVTTIRFSSHSAPHENLY